MRPEAKALLIERSSVGMKSRVRHLIATFIASALIASTGHAQANPGTNPLETRAKEVARAVSTAEQTQDNLSV